MRTFDFKSPALSAVAFFGTLGILSVGYSAYSSLSAVTSGQPLTVGMWTQVKDNFDNLNARTANVLSSGTYVGIGTSSPISTLTVKSTNNSGYL
ncbi:MAG: Peptidase protein [Patescibacteria group bacterium]|nr:Peptidase protein [Patescibacteria group bacterium]